jgi:hypothetical protein
MARADPTNDSLMLTALRRTCRLVVLLTLAISPVPRVLAADVPPPVYRVFLRDGTALAALGEWVRVGDRCVFTVAVGEGSDAPLQLASVPAGSVDWPATERYRDGLRASSYAATRGDQDFAVLSDQVARLLNEAALVQDLPRRVALAEQARRLLVDWPAAHFGYRSDEVRQILSLVDDIVSGLRASMGDTRFDLALVAWAVPPPAPKPLPPPSLQEAVSQALRLADLAESPAEKVSLLRTASVALERGRTAAPRAWASATKAAIARSLHREVKLDEKYAAVRTRALGAASRAAGNADVRGVERAIERVRRSDAALGGQRPDLVRGLIVVLEERLDAARRLRLARDRWAVKSESLETYRKATSQPLGDLAKVKPALEDVKALAGPDLSRLARVQRALFDVQTRLTRVAVPDDVKQAHALALSATQLAMNAARLRRDAVASGRMQPAWDASAAAAGALMLIDRARQAVGEALEPPRLQ